MNAKLTGKLDGYMTAYRVSCARAVVAEAERRGLPERAAVIAVTTTIVESTIENLTYGDRDSVGLFQQRASWGSESERLNPAYATSAFLDKMLRLYSDGSWKTRPIGEVAQGVQVSATPDAYQPQAADGQRIVDALQVVKPPAGAASIYGVLNDGRLTYSVIDMPTGNRTHTVSSTETLGFVPVALATLNFNTLLVTSPEGVLHRVDISTNSTSLKFSAPVALGGGWTHDMLTYDGHGHLYGIADGKLLQYVVSGTKPTSGQVGMRKEIGTGFTLKNLTATGDDWLLGVSNTGELRSYKIAADGTWAGATLADRWGSFTHLLSPGSGIYYGRTSAGAMYHYFDANPFDLSGTDLDYNVEDPVDEGGWTQILLSAQTS
ncbi:hypothetical protein J5X75_18515 [Actinoplanes sp. NEAU-H7]|uniref:Tachylectin 2 domain-containing protein n=1 Tax=Actinoplanes flavus TaxID=2820290 RepID=A0ABS3UM37_9ACTN|nr:hypothetical protein [Actinoplanes flavus]